MRAPTGNPALSRRAAGLAVTLALIWGMGASAEEAPAPIRVAMLPIVVHSADDPVFLREGLADMLTARMDQVGGFEIIHISDLNLATTNLDEALSVGRDAGAEFVLFGSFTRFGTGASLDMQCASTTQVSGEPHLREIFVHSGSIGEVIPDLDNLVGKLSRFAMKGYADEKQAETGTQGDAEGAPNADAGATEQELEDLTLRIQSLEATLEELASAVYEDRETSPADEPDSGPSASSEGSNDASGSGPADGERDFPESADE